MWRVVLFLSAAIVLAQDTSVFRTTTQLVRIDVVAQDKNGNPVADLGKDDFVLTVNRKPQRIDTFTVSSTAPEPTVALRAALSAINRRLRRYRRAGTRFSCLIGAIRTGCFN